MRLSSMLAFAVATFTAFGTSFDSSLSGDGLSPAVAAAQSDNVGSGGPSSGRRSHHRPRAQRAPATVVSFPGFRINADGTSRCFVHVSSTIVPENHASGRRFEVRIPGGSVAARNHMNPLETQFFNTPMVRARLERRGRHDLVLVIDLRADVALTSRVETDPSGGVLVVVDFPAGAYVTAPPTIRRTWDDDASEDDGGEYSSVRPSAGASGEPPRSDERSSVRPSRASDRETVAPAQTSGGAAATPDGSVSTTPPPANARTTGHDTERPPMFGN